MFRIKNKPEILLCKIEGLFLILNKTEQLSCFTRVLPIKIQKSILLLLKFFLIPFTVKPGIDNQSTRCILYTRKKNYLSISNPDAVTRDKKYFFYLNQLSKLWVDIELKSLRICAGFYAVGVEWFGCVVMNHNTCTVSRSILLDLHYS